MRFPLHVTTDMVLYQIRRTWRDEKRYPFVLMLEPLYACNLACVGCSTERHTGKVSERLPLETCLNAVDDCGAPSVSICGGEPTLYPELPALIDGIVARKRHVYLCTNGLLLDAKVFGRIPPAKRLTINVHLDGMRKTHDEVCAREGVFDKAVEMIREAKRLGYHVMTNTTVFKSTELAELEELCAFVAGLGVDGMLLSPGYHYESVENDVFLARAEIQKKFQGVLELSKRFPVSSTPMYLEFVAGKREYDCSPWSTVTFTPRGWKGPCYLIGEQFTADWTEFWAKTNWSYWESRADRRCQNCAMHSGFEASAVRGLAKSPRDLARMAAWSLFG
ncbi:MAG TPA: adenosyl-hopene transferase HpnH [Polyangia bacterium]|jgi:hopanoid biosynthesis associated radical SAM protein HpnH|nr:adenosyl-hopene transferase HpnH [Polyangia bacterium]